MDFSQEIDNNLTTTAQSIAVLNVHGVGMSGMKRKMRNNHGNALLLRTPLHQTGTRQMQTE